MVERVGGLQTQYAPSAYIALWSRMEGFERGALTRALERKRIVQATMMRVTIHMATPRDYALFSAGLRRRRREWWLRIHRDEIEGLDMHAVAGRVRHHLSGGPLRSSRLIELLRNDGFPSVVWSGAGLWVDLVRVPPSGTWEQRRADLYGLAERWVGRTNVSESEGLEHLVRRYLGGFGPATPNEAASWAAISVSTMRPVMDRMKLRSFRCEDGRVRFDIPRAALPDADTPAPVRLLPPWEALTLANVRRTHVLPEEYRSKVFDMANPQLSTFLVDGQVAGSWRYEAGRVRVQPFHPLPKATRRELDEEAAALAAFHEG